MYKKAMGLCSNATEKKMVLSGLPRVKSVESLRMAADYLDQNDLRQEAQAAVVEIARGTKDKHPKETRELLQKVLRTSKNEGIRNRAQELLKQIK